MYDKQALIDLIKETASSSATSRLPSGKKATFYLRLPQGHARLARSEADRRRDARTRSATSSRSSSAAWRSALTPSRPRSSRLAGVKVTQLRGVMVRKEPSQHGTGKYVEGPYAAGEELVIVEDVVTTGGSSLLAIERCGSRRPQSEASLAIVDRLEGGREAFAGEGYELTTLLTIKDFGITP